MGFTKSIEYPRTLRENAIYRAELLSAAENDVGLQNLLRETCKRDRLFWFYTFAYTYDPRRPRNRMVPFIPYDFQVETILWDAECSDRGLDSLNEKSRDMGVTWLYVLNDWYDWGFKDDKIAILWGSRKEDLVDKIGDDSTIFEKFRIQNSSTPRWLMPRGMEEKDHDNFMRIINPETGSTIIGESSNANFGRGGRKYRVRFDEFAFWDNDKAAWQSCADVTLCRTAISTPNGASNKFATLAKSDIQKRTLHWTLHPKKRVGAYVLDPQTGQRHEIDMSKNGRAAYMIWLEKRLEVPPKELVGGLVRSPWYDAECERRNKREVAEELDIDYLGSGMPFFDLRMLKKQQPWEYYERDRAIEPIPHGKYIRANLVEADHRVEHREGPTGWLRVFELPQPGKQYVVSSDTAEGLEKCDESFLVVRDRYNRNVVASANGAFTPDEVALKQYKLGKWYNNALLAPENNNHGYSVCSDLTGMDANLYWTKRKDSKGNKTKVKPGWSTTPVTRPQMLDEGREEIKKLTCEVRCPVLLSQMETFVHSEKKGKPEADGDFLDDGVIAYCIGSAVIKEYPFRTETKETATHKLYTSKRQKFRFRGGK